MKYILAALLACAAVYTAAQTPTPGPAPQPGVQIVPPSPHKPLSREQLLKNAAALEEGVRKSPEDAELRVKLGFTYIHLERVEDAQREFEAAVRLNPKKAIAQYMLGLIYEKKGLRAQAVAAMKACLDNAADPLLREKASVHLHRLSSEVAQ